MFVAPVSCFSSSALLRSSRNVLRTRKLVFTFHRHGRDYKIPLELWPQVSLFLVDHGCSSWRHPRRNTSSTSTLLLCNLFKVRAFSSLESDRFYLTQLSCWHNEELQAVLPLLRDSATIDCSSIPMATLSVLLPEKMASQRGDGLKKTHTLCSKGFDVAQAPANTSTTAAATPTPQPAAGSRPLYSTVCCALPDYGRPHFTSFFPRQSILARGCRRAVLVTLGSIYIGSPKAATSPH